MYELRALTAMAIINHFRNVVIYQSSELPLLRQKERKHFYFFNRVSRPPHPLFSRKMEMKNQVRSEHEEDEVNMICSASTNKYTAG